MPEQPEVLGLLALMEIQASRLTARAGPDGRFVPLTEQNRARWDQLLIRRGLNALDAPRRWAERTGLMRCRRRLRLATPGRVRRRQPTGSVLLTLYDRLGQVMPSPVVELNRAVAYSMAFGPEAGLRLVDAIADAAVLRNYAPLPAARGDFLFRAGRPGEARVQFEAAAALSSNERERDFLLARAAACAE